MSFAISGRKGSNSELEAADYYEENIKGGYGAGGNRKRRREYWHARLLKHGHVLDAPRSGRPPCIPDDTIFVLARLLLLGYFIKIAGRVLWRGFTSLEKAATNPNAKELRKEISKLHVDTNLRSVARRIKQLVPWLPGTKRDVDFKMQLSNDTKEQREKVSAEHMSLIKLKGPAVLDTVTWIDAKKMFIAPGQLTVYNMNTEDVAEDVRLPEGKQHNGIITALLCWCQHQAWCGGLLLGDRHRWTNEGDEDSGGY